MSAVVGGGLHGNPDRPEIALLAAYPPSHSPLWEQAEAERQYVHGLWAEFAAANAEAADAESAVATLRSTFDRMFSQFPMPPWADRRWVDAGGTPALLVSEGAPKSRVLILLHGGAFVAGSAEVYESFAARLARAAGADVLVPDYRLAPEHAAPAALEDAVAAYRWLLACGTPAEQIAFVGDGSGGGLVMAALLALRDAGDRLPAAAVCVSPMVDATCGGRSMLSHALRDPATSRAALSWLMGRYVAGQDPKDPSVSPLLGDLRGLPPMFVLVGSEEVLLDDALRLVDRAVNAGVDARLHVGLGHAHAWPLFAPVLTAGGLAVDGIGAFVRSAIPASPQAGRPAWHAETDAVGRQS